MARSYKGLTKLTRNLLASGENQNVDYKENVNGLQPEDIIAFANTDAGGHILLGVKEHQDTSGQMCGSLQGHNISDGTILKIKNKAETCIPPVPLAISIENLDSKPIIRISIKSGMFKPYCTKKGTYKIRGDSRNEALYPDQLLAMFMQREEQKFLNRFSSATLSLERNLLKTLKTVSNLEDAIDHKLDEIMWDLSTTESEAADASTKMDQVIALSAENMKQLRTENLRSKEQSDRLKAVMKTLDTHDPSTSTFSSMVKAYLKERIKETPLFQKEFLEAEAASFQISNDWLDILDEEIIRKLVLQIVEDMREESKN